MDVRTQYYLHEILSLAFLLTVKIAPFVLMIIGSFLIRRNLRLRSAAFMLLGAIVAFLSATANVMLFCQPFNLLPYSKDGMITTAQEMSARLQLVQIVEISLTIVSSIGILIFSISFLLIARNLPATPKTP